MSTGVKAIKGKRDMKFRKGIMDRYPIKKEAERIKEEERAKMQAAVDAENKAMEGL